MSVTKAEQIRLCRIMLECWLDWHSHPAEDHCTFYDPETYTGPETTYYTLYSGDSFTLSGMTFDLSSSIIPCDKHRPMLEEAFDKQDGAG